MMSNPSDKIAIIDDNMIVAGILLKRLRLQGYEVLIINDHKDIVNKIFRLDPQLIIMDYSLPEINGIDICKILKNNERTQEIPIIFLTSSDDLNEKVRAFDSGAVDYITRPVRLMELYKRIETHIELSKAKANLKTYAHHVEQLAEERAQQLINSDRMATLGRMTASMAHEINNPTTFISSNVQTLEMFWKFLRAQFRLKDPNNHSALKKLSFIKTEMPKVLVSMKQGVNRITKLVGSLKNYSRADSAEKKKIDLVDCVETAFLICQKYLKERVYLSKHYSKRKIFAIADANQIQQIIINLIVNAVDAMEQIQNPRIDFYIKSMKKNIKIIIVDNGPGIPKENIDDIWNPFFTTKEAGKGTGLGLSIVRSIVEAHEGSIEVFNVNDAGACFEVSLPHHLVETKNESTV